MSEAKEGKWKAAKCKLLIGDCRETLKSIPGNSIHCCVTSPPYWGLRDYKVSGQIGQEKTPELYVENMVNVFREVRRVLRNDGTLWLNLGDTTVNKQLQCVPWRVALALQADGWVLRQDIIWAKPAPMPESVLDRCTKAHEYIFLLAKSARYFYDAEAIKEDFADERMGNPGGYKWAYTKGSQRNDHGLVKSAGVWNADGERTGRNKRSVWTVSGKPYKGAHFATFPTDLIEPCVLAGTSAEGCCVKCGAPWARCVERTPMVVSLSKNGIEKHRQGLRTSTSGTMMKRPTSNTTGWQPTCQCDTTEKSRSVVLDPFNGSGTTGEVARLNGCDYIGCELNHEYAKLSEDRWKQGVLL